MCFHWKSISIMACPAVVIFLPWCGPHAAEWRQYVLGGRVLLLYCSKNKIKWLKGQRGTTEAQQRQTTYCSHTSWSTWPFEGTITNKKRYLKWLLTIRPPAVWPPLSFSIQMEANSTIHFSVQWCERSQTQHYMRTEFILSIEPLSLAFPWGKLLSGLLFYLLYISCYFLYVIVLYAKTLKLALDHLR